MMNKKSEVGVMIGLLFLTYMIILFMNGMVVDGRKLYRFELQTMNDENIIVGITLWILPKLLLSYFISYKMFLNYKITYAYFFARSHNIYIWLRKIIMNLCFSASLFELFKLTLAVIIDPSNDYVMITLLELMFIIFVSFIIFTILVISNNEQISLLVIIVIIAYFFGISTSENRMLINIHFLLETSYIAVFIMVLICCLSFLGLYYMIKKKEFYY